MTHADITPIYKVGAIILHPVARGMDVLIVRPQPKHAGEVPPFVMPRGSRQYRDAQGEWQDARDAATARIHAATFEPLETTLIREIEEEAGVPPSVLRKASVYELGVRDFASRSKGVYAIHWFVVILAHDSLPRLHAVPSDAMAVRWENLREVEMMAAHGEFSAGYVPVIREAIQAMENGILARVTL